jgi:hypothetical protein
MAAYDGCKVVDGRIPLGAHRARLMIGSGSWDGAVDVELPLAPSPRLEITGSFPPEAALALHEGDNHPWRACVHFEHGLGPVPALVTSTTIFADPTRIIAVLTEPVRFGTAENASKIEFILLNGLEWLSSEVVDARTLVRFQVRATFGGWGLTLEPVPGLQSVINDLKREGGYRPTHRGFLTRTDNAPFRIVEGCDVLTALHYCLSFARGRWMGPMLPVAFNGGGEMVWEEWAIRTTDSWRNNGTWFDAHHAESLARILPGLWSHWNTPHWRTPLERAIYWYVISNGGAAGIEGGLVLSQAALELLARARLVELGRAPRKRGAARLIRLGLESCDIPVQIPPVLGILSEHVRNRHWIDGPHAITSLRNALVHPEDSSAALDADVGARVQAYSLGQWYLELMLMRICDYEGVYSNRLEPKWVGDVSPVPWARG